MSTSESSESSLASRRGGSGALGGRIEIGMAEDAPCTVGRIARVWWVWPVRASTGVISWAYWSCRWLPLRASEILAGMGDARPSLQSFLDAG